MATGWVKSLHCKSNAVEDVVYQPTPSSKKPLLSAVSCSNSSHGVKDVVFLFPNCSCALSKKPEARQKHNRKQRPARASPSTPAGGLVRPVHAGPFPTLEELPKGHSSRRVVEIIFGSSWSDSAGGAFPGGIEMLFRVDNPARTLARFEEHRAAVRARAVGGARCAADGNEVLRFHLGRGAGGVYDAGVVRSSAGGEAKGVRTFAGSGGAHASGDGGDGRRAMLVCRVIAGRVRGESDRSESDADSVSLGNGELLVFDPRAVLPCFLIIYKL
ncbi:Zinc finger protein [Musa troglodytarum]|uniref:Zinc finger protein n=1 Tax=Musa troglodytarum TaxID=320322 RepID=A0A9E7FH31_9LILI|nr:Zinc finger protein [Musa troglodytarum]